MPLRRSFFSPSLYTALQSLSMQHHVSLPATPIRPFLQDKFSASLLLLISPFSSSSHCSFYPSPLPAPTSSPSILLSIPCHAFHIQRRPAWSDSLVRVHHPPLNHYSRTPSTLKSSLASSPDASPFASSPYASQRSLHAKLHRTVLETSLTICLYKSSIPSPLSILCSSWNGEQITERRRRIEDVSLLPVPAHLLAHNL